MSAHHQKFVATAKRLIDKHGRMVQFEIVSSQPQESDRPWWGTAAAPVVIGPLKAAFVPFRGFEFGSLFEQKSLFKECDEICLVSGGQGDLELAHFLVDEGRKFKIEWVQRLRPGTVTVLYAFGVMR